MTAVMLAQERHFFGWSIVTTSEEVFEVVFEGRGGREGFFEERDVALCV
jgi:hypothetical protein